MPRLITSADIEAAIHWRLAGWPAQDIAQGVASIVDADFDSAYLFVPDNKSPWSARCALGCLAADQQRDTDLALRAGCALVEAQRQSLRARVSGDALDSLIASHLHEMPDLNPKALWQQIAQRGPSERDVHRGRLSEPITYHAFRRRVQRARKRNCSAP